MYRNYTPQPTYGQQPAQRQLSLSDADWANTILCELKRMASEYTTASLEATGEIRRTFEQMLQRTLRDQEQLYHIMGQFNLYGQPTQAHPQDVHKEIQHHQQQRQELMASLSGPPFHAQYSGGTNYSRQPTAQTVYANPSVYTSSSNPGYNRSNSPMYAQHSPGVSTVGPTGNDTQFHNAEMAEEMEVDDATE